VSKYGALIVVTAMAAAVGVVSAFSPSAPADEFNALYAPNCAGCHGAAGTGGAARGLIDPIYLRIADDAVLRGVVARGVPHTAMPAFATAAGGPLTDDQIDALVRGLRSKGAGAGSTGELNPPPYATAASGDAMRGGAAFAAFCSRCHGADGRGGPAVGSIVDPAYLALVSDQSLRTTIIAGRADLNAPDWRADIPGRPMSASEVSDVVAWLAARRMP
jgi:cytochrome c oxidase cbb3-type subunit 3/ubiquinol-cytochrome c reductase cytochrome c subunit